MQCAGCIYSTLLLIHTYTEGFFCKFQSNILMVAYQVKIGTGASWTSHANNKISQSCGGRASPGNTQQGNARRRPWVTLTCNRKAGSSVSTPKLQGRDYYRKFEFSCWCQRCGLRGAQGISPSHCLGLVTKK